MSNVSDYVLQVGEAGRERLELLNELCNSHSMNFLKQEGLAEGMSVLEIGCGIGIMTLQIAKHVTATGKVVGLDISKQQLAIANEKAANEGLSQVTFKEMPVQQLHELKEAFDLIYCRFLLCNLRDGSGVVQHLLPLLKRSGRVVFEEPAKIDGIFSVPHSEIYELWKHYTSAAFSLVGSDSDIGAKLPQILEQVGIEPITIQMCQPVLKNESQKKFLRLNLSEIAPRLIDASIATHEQLLQLQNDLCTFEKESHFAAFFRYVQISGRMKNH